MPVPQGKLEITAEVGGEDNVKRLLKVARDFRSVSALVLSRHYYAMGPGRVLISGLVR
jgi:hypothetical protein